MWTEDYSCCRHPSPLHSDWHSRSSFFLLSVSDCVSHCERGLSMTGEQAFLSFTHTVERNGPLKERNIIAVSFVSLCVMRSRKTCSMVAYAPQHPSHQFIKTKVHYGRIEDMREKGSAPMYLWINDLMRRMGGALSDLKNWTGQRKTLSIWCVCLFLLSPNWEWFSLWPVRSSLQPRPVTSPISLSHLHQKPI